MSIDPDFIVTINGDDVTRYVHEWVLHDKEKGTSTLKVTLKNPDQVLSDKYDTEMSVSIIFGYTGDYADKVTMDIKKYSESYSVDEKADFIEVVGMDALDALTGSGLNTGGTDKAAEKPKV